MSFIVPRVMHPRNSHFISKSQCLSSSTSPNSSSLPSSKLPNASTTCNNGSLRISSRDRSRFTRPTVHSAGQRNQQIPKILPHILFPRQEVEVSLQVLPWIALAFLLVFPLVSMAALPESIQVGGIFDDLLENEEPYDEVAFLHAVDRINAEGILAETSKMVAFLERVPFQDSYHAELKLCTMFQEGITAIFGPQSPSTANHVQSACDNFQIPRIETTWDFRNKRGNYTVNLHPHPDILSKAFADVITAWGWDKYIIVYENHESLIRLKELLHQSNIYNGRHVRVRQLPLNSDDYKPLFKEIRNSAGNSAIIIDCSSEKLPRIFEHARETGMVKDRRYFVTSLDIRLLSPHDFDPADGINITAFSILDPENEQAHGIIHEWAEMVAKGHPEFEDDVPPLPNNMLKTETALMYDGMMLLAKALEALDASQLPDHDRQFGTMSINCRSGGGGEDGEGGKWTDGKILLEALRNIQFDGVTGPVEIDMETGFRTSFQLDVIELTKTGFSRIGIYDSGEEVEEDKRFTWTRTVEETLRQQEEDLKDKVLVVTTIIGAPYAIKEPGGNISGYVPDLIEKISGLLQFQYEIKEVSDGKYGSPDNETGQWNGMIGEVMSGVADLAAADLSISFNRQSAVDFTMPFMSLGISILYKTPAKDPPALFSFLEPFNVEVWIYVMTAYLCISLVLFMLARLSPHDWQEPPPCSPDAGQVLENPFSMANCLWFSTGTIMGQGCDILPAAVCTRTATISWWFFVLIMISSYTANLAAFLANEGMGSSIKAVSDLPNQHKVKYGCVKGGTTCKFFETNTFPLYKEIYIAMTSMRPDPFEDTTPGGVDRVKKANGSYAFFMESTSLEYAMANDPECRLTQIGGLLDSKGYGIALRKNSQYRNAFSNAILLLAEKGELETLKKKWWAGTGLCDNTEPPPGGATALSMANVGGVFVVLVGGVIMSSTMSAIEFIWKARKLAKNIHENFFVLVWRELRFAIFCEGETKPVKKSATNKKCTHDDEKNNDNDDSPGSEAESVNDSLPYLAFHQKEMTDFGMNGKLSSKL